MKIYRIGNSFPKPSDNWFGKGSIFGYTRTDNFKSDSVRLAPEISATWGQKNGITHEEVFGLIQREIPAFTWIYDIGRNKMDGWGWDEKGCTPEIKKSAMEEVMSKL